ncbi:MAG: 5-formyltetrahydrofolate cyclo-ligase [Planctomycetales bacterium]
MVDSKQQRRLEMKAIRNSLQDRDISKRSQIIEEQLLSLDAVQAAAKFFIYVSFRSEVQTHHLIDKLIASGKQLTVPHVVDAKMMHAVRFTAWDQMSPDRFGVLTPVSPVLDEDKIDICIAPGLAFSVSGDRLGYGKGHYDRFLARCRPRLAIGLALDCQIVESLPSDQFDRQMDLIVTEQRIIELGTEA